MRRIEDLLPEEAVAAGRKVSTVGLKLTDLGNAERLVARYRDRIRYCPPMRTWLVWDGNRWTWDETGEVVRLAKATVRAIYGEAEHARGDDEAKAIARHAAKSEDGARIKAMIGLAQSEHGIPVMPVELDADPWLLNVRNGTIDLRTGELHEHRRADLITKLAPVTYDSMARHEMWERFLEEATGGDTELVGYLQRFVGYALTGLVSEKKFFFIHGPHDSSKSTFVDALTATLGSYAVTADSTTWLEQTTSGGNRGDLVRLAGARLVASVEVKKGKRWDEALIKRVVGGDMITAAAKFKDEVAFRATFKILLAANDAPSARDDDDGMWSRMQRIPFNHQVLKKDPAVKATLSDPSAAGPAILAWAVRGCIAWQKMGLGTASAVEASTADYRKEMDRVAGFFAERCVFESWDAIRISRKELRGAYDRWCRDNDVRYPLSAKDFAERVRAAGGIDGTSNGVAIWKCVRLRRDDELVAGASGVPRGTDPLSAPSRAGGDKESETDAPSCPCHPSGEDEEREAIQTEPVASGGALW